MGSSVEWVRWLSVAVSVVLPLLVALITARVADSAVKALVLLVLATLSGVGTAVLDAQATGQAIDLGQLLFDALVSFLLAVGWHFGLLKPVNLTGANGVVQTKVPAGVGGRHAA